MGTQAALLVGRDQPLHIADGTVFDGDPSATVVRTDVGRYTITFPAGFWSGGSYPAVSIQPYFGGPQGSIPFASGNAETWNLEFKDGATFVDTTFNITFIQG